MQDPAPPRLDRRQALRLIGAGGLGLSVARRTAGDLLAAPARAASGTGPAAFRDGSVIRTILADPDQRPLAHGTTLFHEHPDGVCSQDMHQLPRPPPSGYAGVAVRRAVQHHRPANTGCSLSLISRWT